jgi:hypothetical protein
MALQMRLQQGILAQSRVRHARFVPFTTQGPVIRQTSINVPASNCCSHRPVVFSTAAPQQQRAAVAARASPSGNNNTEQLSLPDGSVSVVLLAGGVGKRMGASIPKQYLELKGQPIATYSLLMFGAMREVRWLQTSRMCTIINDMAGESSRAVLASTGAGLLRWHLQPHCCQTC